MRHVRVHKRRKTRKRVSKRRPLPPHNAMRNPLPPRRLRHRQPLSNVTRRLPQLVVTLKRQKLPQVLHTRRKDVKQLANMLLRHKKVHKPPWRTPRLWHRLTNLQNTPKLLLAKQKQRMPFLLKRPTRVRKRTRLNPKLHPKRLRTRMRVLKRPSCVKSRLLPQVWAFKLLTLVPKKLPHLQALLKKKMRNEKVALRTVVRTRLKPLAMRPPKPMLAMPCRPRTQMKVMLLVRQNMPFDMQVVRLVRVTHTVPKPNRRLKQNLEKRVSHTSVTCRPQRPHLWTNKLHNVLRRLVLQNRQTLRQMQVKLPQQVLLQLVMPRQKPLNMPKRVHKNVEKPSHLLDVPSRWLMHSSCLLVAYWLKKPKLLPKKKQHPLRQSANCVRIQQVVKNLRKRQKPPQLRQPPARLLQVRQKLITQPLKLAPNRRHYVLVRGTQKPRLLKVMQKVPVAELHVRQRPQLQPPMPKAQCQLVLPKFWPKRVPLTPYLRRHQFKLWNRLCQTWWRLLVVKKCQPSCPKRKKKHSPHLHPPKPPFEPPRP